MSDQEQTGKNADGEKADISEGAIRQRAFEISQSPEASSPEENWERAKRELEGEQ